MSRDFHRAPTGESLILALTVLAASACSMSPEMERAAPATPACPGEGLGRAVEAPDTTQLQWYRAAGERDVSLASQWCATVDEPVLQLTPASTFSSWEPNQGLEIISWNMEIGEGNLYRMLREEFGLDCSAARPSVRSGRPPFVVLLQEVWRYSASMPQVEGSSVVPRVIDLERETGPNSDIVVAAKACGLALVYVPSARNGADDSARSDQDKGNAILSTLPLSTPIAMDLPLEGGRKVAVAATVYGPGGQRVRLMSVQLDAVSTLVRTLLSGNQTRARQTNGLVDAIDRAENDGPLTAVNLIGGDFNTWTSTEYSLKLMRQAFPESPEWDGLDTRGSFPMDHIFFRRKSFTMYSVDGYRRLEDSYGSDHTGRGVTLRYTAPTG